MRSRFPIIFLCCALTLAWACDAKPAERRQAPAPTQAVEPVTLPAHADLPPGLPPAHPPIHGADHGETPPKPSGAAASQIKGEVLETMDAASYTYVRVKTEDGRELWVAGPQAVVAVGQQVEFPPGMAMYNFESKSLGRTFEEILFVEQLIAGSKPLSQQGQGGPAKVDPLNIPALPLLEGGLTVAQLLDNPSAHAGQSVKLRAAVVHQNSAILGRNWLHVQDGSRSTKNQFDLTVTTTQTAQTGDVLIIQGKVSVDRDFGAGYRYEVLIEDAQIEVERR